MDIDPLQDAPPARYAVESDSEDEIGHYPGPRSNRVPHAYKIESNIPKDDHGSLIVVCAPTAQYWLTGLEGQTIGSIRLDGTSVVEYWRTDSKQLIAVLTHRLPLGAQSLIARSILETRENKPIIILDSYSHLTYISSQSRSQDDHPIRYLGTSSSTPALPKKIETFAPPNLIQHLAAALVAECEYLQVPATILLIPTRRIPPPAPPRPMEHSTADDLPPSLSILEGVTKCVASLSQVSIDHLNWKASKIGQKSAAFKAQSRAKHLDMGEGSMYI